MFNLKICRYEKIYLVSHSYDVQSFLHHLLCNNH
jgi:hypothetical protein